MTDFAEKRDFYRMALDCSLEFQVAGNDKVYQGRVVNLSATGVLFVASEPVQSSTELSVTLTPVSDITPPMSANCRVIRCDELSEDEFQIASEIIKIL